MPHYSPPLPFRRGIAGSPCVLASPRRRPARGSRRFTLAGVPRPASPGRGSVHARWPVGPRPCAARGSRSCALAGGPPAAPRARVADVQAGWRAHARELDCVRLCARLPAGQHPCPAWVRAPSHPLCCDDPALLASLCSPFSGVFPFLHRYISLARNIGYVTIKPMTKYCLVFMLSLAGVQQDRNSGLVRNYGAAIREKSVQ